MFSLNFLSQTVYGLNKNHQIIKFAVKNIINSNYLFDIEHTSLSTFILKKNIWSVHFLLYPSQANKVIFIIDLAPGATSKSLQLKTTGPKVSTKVTNLVFRLDFRI